MTAQESVLFSPFLAPLNALPEHILDGPDHRTRTPTVPRAPFSSWIGRRNSKGSLDLGV